MVTGQEFYIFCPYFVFLLPFPWPNYSLGFDVGFVFNYIYLYLCMCYIHAYYLWKNSWANFPILKDIYLQYLQKNPKKYFLWWTNQKWKTVVLTKALACLISVGISNGKTTKKSHTGKLADTCRKWWKPGDWSQRNVYKWNDSLYFEELTYYWSPRFSLINNTRYRSVRCAI